MLTYFNSKSEAFEFFEKVMPGLVQSTIFEIHELFTQKELEVLIKVMQGIDLVPGASPTILVEELVDSVRLDMLPQKNNVKAAPLIKKLQSLTSFQSTILAVWAKRYWDLFDESPVNISSYANTFLPVHNFSTSQ